MSKQEEEEVHKQVANTFEKGLTEPSVSPCGACLDFICAEKDGFLRMCIEKKRKIKDYAGSENHSPHLIRKRSHFGTEYRKAPPPQEGKEK